MRNLTIPILVATFALNPPAWSQDAIPTPPSGQRMGDGHGPGLPATRDEAAARVREQFARLDRNGDGFLTSDELPRRGGGGSALTRFDSNKDGKLSLDEFEQRALAMFDRLDADHDGKISGAERDAWRARMRPPQDG